MSGAGAPVIHETGSVTNAVSSDQGWGGQSERYGPLTPTLSPTMESTPGATPNVGERGQNLVAADLPGAQICTHSAASTSACADCPLRAKCLSAKADHREINRYPHDDLIEAQAQLMATPEAKQKYAARRYRGERSFAQIKHHFGARGFLLRGLKQVRIEWNWLTIAFNLRTLLTLLQPRPGPHPATHNRRPLPPSRKTPLSSSLPLRSPGSGGIPVPPTIGGDFGLPDGYGFREA